MNYDEVMHYAAASVWLTKYNAYTNVRLLNLGFCCIWLRTSKSLFSKHDQALRPFWKSTDFFLHFLRLANKKLDSLYCLVCSSVKSTRTLFKPRIKPTQFYCPTLHMSLPIIVLCFACFMLSLIIIAIFGWFEKRILRCREPFFFFF